MKTLCSVVICNLKLRKNDKVFAQQGAAIFADCWTNKQKIVSAVLAYTHVKIHFDNTNTPNKIF